MLCTVVPTTDEINLVGLPEGRQYLLFVAYLALYAHCTCFLPLSDGMLRMLPKLTELHDILIILITNLVLIWYIRLFK